MGVSAGPGSPGPAAGYAGGVGMEHLENVDPERGGQFLDHVGGRRIAFVLDLADIGSIDLGGASEIFLRQPLRQAQGTQVDR